MELDYKEIFRELITQLTLWGYKPKIPANPMDFIEESKRSVWINEKGMKPFNFYSESLPVGEIDIVLDSPIPYEILREYLSWPVERRLKWLFIGNKLRRDLPQKIIEKAGKV